MRLTMDRRWLGGLLIAAVAIGCNGKPKAGGSTEGSNSGSSRGGSGPVIPNGPTGRQQAEAFLKDLGDGKVTPDKLTPAFKKKLAPPNKDADAVAKDWLNQFKGATFTIGEEAKVGDAVAVRGRVKLQDNAMAAFALRLVNGQADWLHQSGDRQGSEIKTLSDPSMAAAQDTVRNFLDLLLGGDLKQAHALMTTEWKKALSPAGPQDIKDGYAYGPGFLMGKTRAWKGDYLTYTLTPTDHGSSKDTIVFVATMDAGNRKDKHTVKATKDPATGEWLVADFEKQ